MDIRPTATEITGHGRAMPIRDLSIMPLAITHARPITALVIIRDESTTARVTTGLVLMVLIEVTTARAISARAWPTADTIEDAPRPGSDARQMETACGSVFQLCSRDEDWGLQVMDYSATEALRDGRVVEVCALGPEDRLLPSTGQVSNPSTGVSLASNVTSRSARSTSMSMSTL